jgi:eukaryotic-like serine/threonine-protein kinase
MSLYKKGDVIGQKYEVHGVLGQGGFGVVYLVYSYETGSVYALKTFRDEYLKDVATRERFRQESSVWVDMESHPYLVRAWFVDEISGRLYIAMEYIAPDDQGLNSLEEYLHRRPPDLAQGLRWAIQVCHGMEYAYSRGIRCHRDIKPANILISQDRVVKITDFGLAGVLGTTRTTSEFSLDMQQGRVGLLGQTIEGTGFGTVTHMPPEQFTNAAACDQRSDIYAFGIVLYQIVTAGALPFLAPKGYVAGRDGPLLAGDANTAQRIPCAGIGLTLGPHYPALPRKGTGQEIPEF